MRLTATLTLVVARARRRPTRWGVPALGIALSVAFAGAVAAERVVAGDQGARAVLNGFSPLDRTVRERQPGRGLSPPPCRGRRSGCCATSTRDAERGGPVAAGQVEQGHRPSGRHPPPRCLVTGTSAADARSVSLWGLPDAPRRRGPGPLDSDRGGGEDQRGGQRDPALGCAARVRAQHRWELAGARDSRRHRPRRSLRPSGVTAPTPGSRRCPRRACTPGSSPRACIEWRSARLPSCRAAVSSA